MRQIHNIKIELLIKQPKYLKWPIVIVCLTCYLVSTISTFSQATLVVSYEFNVSSNLGLESINTRNLYLGEISDEGAISLGHNGSKLINFRHSSESGLTGVNGTMNLPSGIRSMFDSSQDGYTIICRVLLDGTFSDSSRKQILWAKDGQGRVIFGLKRSGQQLFFDRYVRGSDGSILNSWVFKLWEPIQFEETNNEFDFYYIAIAVTENLFRVKVFSPGYQDGECLGCELVYLGGQLLKDPSESVSFGLGSTDGTNSSIYAIDYFRIYSKALTFDEIDQQYATDMAVSSAKTVSNPKPKPHPEELVSEMNIYPNPNSGNFTLKFSLINQDKISYTLYSLDGRQVLSKKEQTFGSGTHSLQIDASHLASGMYFLNVKGGEFSLKGHKIIIE